MNPRFFAANYRQAHRLGAALIPLLISVLAQPVWAQATSPSQVPLLVNPTGAKPNLMLSFDNSGSMAYPFHETYGITGDSLNNGARGNEWIAQRSAQVNPVYYDPRVNYTPRVNADGTTRTATDNIFFVSNQASTLMAYYATYDVNNNFAYANSMTANGSTRPGGVPGTNATAFPAVGNLPNVYNLTAAINGNKSIPQHVTYNSAAAANGRVFTWGVCNTVVNIGGQQVGCTNSTQTNVTYGSAASITLPAGHNRSAACPGGICTTTEEVRNIVTWYRYYSTRATAASTAIGQALANADYDNQLRVGYFTIDRPVAGNMQTDNSVNPGQAGENVTFSRGVRMLRQNNDANTNQFYDWLYNIPIAGGTPLHNSVDRVANYYRMVNGTVENPYRTTPNAATSATNPELSCRRSFNLLFSDGSWTSTSSTNLTQNSDFEQGPEFTSVNGVKFRYQPQGVNTLSGRKSYIPYGGISTGGLADLTARYYWTLDFRNLDNSIATRIGQPTFWQNMATYTVGYQIKPSGEVLGATSGLTFAQIDQYKTQYSANGYAAAVKPDWPTGEMNVQADRLRVDDFIQAGYTGGGRGFSAASADDVRRIFNIILSDILNASGSDAGVAVSASGSTTSNVEGTLKYLVSFRTLDNSGDISAYRLTSTGSVEVDADGNPVLAWTSNDTVPSTGGAIVTSSRNIFSITGKNTGFEFKGTFPSLPADTRAALSLGDSTPTRISTNSDFVNYLRGLDPVADANGALFRQRPSILGAMVNPPTVYVGETSYLNYNFSSSDVGGKSAFTNYVAAKKAAPASVLVATNAGATHVLNAKTGVELAAFMPRRSLGRMLRNARDDYSFEYVLDGPLSENDVYDSSTKTWQHIAIGTGGRGEKLIYALRSPINATATGSNRQPTEKDFLWETGPTTLPSNDTANASNELNTNRFAVGHMTQEARAGQTDNGTWIVAINSGHYNGETDGSKHGLLILNPFTGDVLKRIPLPTAYSAGRGLSGITMIRNEKLRIVGAYAGDANGNLWRFSLMGPRSTWGVTYDKPLFTTANNRPIYGNPAWQTHTQGGAIVVVATGMLLEDSDIGDTATDEAIYGIWDPTLLDGTEKAGFATALPSELVTQNVTPTSVASSGTGADATTYYNSSQNKIDWTKKRGWTMPLGWKLKGERSLTGVMNLKRNVVIATTVVSAPDDTTLESCTASNSPGNFIYSLRAIDGWANKSFDYDNDGKADKVSVLEVPGGGYARGNALISPSNSSTGGPDGGPAIGISSGSKGENYDESCGPGENSDPYYITGQPKDPKNIYPNCPSGVWSRTQYQLSAPPSK
jgi:type IV pilus assembly protein PilY1